MFRAAMPTHEFLILTTLNLAKKTLPHIGEFRRKADLRCGKRSEQTCKFFAPIAIGLKHIAKRGKQIGFSAPPQIDVKPVPKAVQGEML